MFSPQCDDAAVDVLHFGAPSLLEIRGPDKRGGVQSVETELSSQGQPSSIEEKSPQFAREHLVAARYDTPKLAMTFVHSPRPPDTSDSSCQRVVRPNTVDNMLNSRTT